MACAGEIVVSLSICTMMNLLYSHTGRRLLAPSRLLTALIFIVAALCVSAQSVESLPDPNIGNRHDFISDPYGMLSPEVKTLVNSRLDSLRNATTCEVGVAVVKTTGDMPVEEYAYDLFRHWGLGKKDKNNGVLLLIAADDRAARIEVGSGAEGVIPDVAAGKIIRRAVMPAMKRNDPDRAVTDATAMISAALSDPAVAEELRSSRSARDSIESPVSSDMIFGFLCAIAFTVFLLTLIMFIIDLFAVRKRDNYRRAMIWHTHMRTYWWGSLFSLGLALPIAFIAWRLYRHSRDVPEICDSCGAKMRKLSEEEDNAYLSGSQDLEERLGTVDYDVWLCPECGSVERFPFVEHQLKYRKCPECGTIAMTLEMDKIVVPPTTTRAGHGERVYQCQFCRHTHREGYVIPKKPDPAAAAVAAGIAAGSSRGGSGGGGFGGGFGGGMSSGGGASGHW